jgi:hypothetical protein
MKQAVLVGILAGALAGSGYAQGTAQQSAPTTGQTSTAARRAAKPAEAQAAGEVLGTIRLARPVKANDQPLAAGTYQVRLSSDEVKPAAGASAQSERWVEFVQRGEVKGREIASVVPNSEVPQIAEDRQAPPAPGQAKVQMLKDEKYVRVWLNKGGNSYLIHLPPQ